MVKMKRFVSLTHKTEMPGSGYNFVRTQQWCNDVDMSNYYNRVILAVFARDMAIVRYILALPSNNWQKSINLLCIDWWNSEGNENH